jgi:UDP-GlcNAc:undecaprenyl-phosphate/decaprenyl-phosphate GlcNAc-1-phosphate transferase
LVGITLIASGAASFLVCWAALAIAHRRGFLDEPDPDGLKIHHGGVPPVGGVGVLIGVVTGLLLIGSFDPGVIVALSLVFILGLVDDARGLSPQTRLVGVAIAALSLAVFGAQASDPITLVGLVLLVLISVNAINLFDGLDLLAGVVSALAAVGLTGLALMRDVPEPWAVAPLAAALIGFLVWNFPPARAFLGDNGSYTVGLSLAWSVFAFGSEFWDRMVGVAILGLPLIDLGVTLLRRVRAGTALFTGDRDHLYDRLHSKGITVVRVVALFALAQVLWMSSVLILTGLFGDEVAVLTAFLGGLALVLFLSTAGQGRQIGIER